MSQLDFRPQAAADLEEAALWYESQRRGLGFEFLDAAESQLLRIAENPHQFPIVYRDARRALLRRLPFAIYFRLQEQRVLVVAGFVKEGQPVAAKDMTSKIAARANGRLSRLLHGWQQPRQAHRCP